MSDELVVREPDNDEDDGQHAEAHKLNGLSANGVHESDSYPVARNRSGAHDDQITNSGVVEDLVHAVALGETDRAENNGVIEAEAIEGNLWPVSILNSSPC